MAQHFLLLLAKSMPESPVVTYPEVLNCLAVFRIRGSNEVVMADVGLF